jgi:drug/metabolite transporter (DMT)-like permease
VTAAVLALVLFASIMHAAWNALVKASDDRLAAGSLVMVAGAIVFGLPLILVVPFPDENAWAYLIASIAIHLAYIAFLARAYREGDLGQVYPLARGSGPLFLALGTLAVGGEVGWQQLAGILVISAGVISLARRPASYVSDGGRPVLHALATGLMIAAYSYVDGMGTRATTEPLSYIGWSFFLHGLAFTALLALTRRATIVATLKRDRGRVLATGILACGAYGIVLWAMTLAPIASVAALRETSVVVAVLIGSLLMHEPFGWRRAAAAAVVASGIVVLATS